MLSLSYITEMAQHSRKSSETNSSDSELSDGWHVIDDLEDFSLEDSNNIKANSNLNKHIVDQGRVLVSDNSNHLENRLVYHENSSDGESIEVIDNDVSPIDDLHDSQLLDSYDLVKDIGGEDSGITDENLLERNIPLETDKIELWKPFFEKFQEIFPSWISYILCGLGCLIMLNIFGIVMQSTPKDFNPSQYTALEGTEDVNKNGYASDRAQDTGHIDHTYPLADEAQHINHIDHTNPLVDSEVINTFYQANTEILSNLDNDIIIGDDKQTNNILSTNKQQLTSIDQKMPIEILEKDNSLLKDVQGNTLNIPDKKFNRFEDINKVNFENMSEKKIVFDTRNLGKAFKLLSDLTNSKDSKYKLGQTLMSLDYLLMKLADLQPDMENSALFLKLKKQQLRISEGFSKKIIKKIGKSVDKLVNNIFNRAKKLENSIEMELCRVKEDLIEVENYQSYLFHDCDTIMEKKDKQIEKRFEKYLDKNNIGKSFTNKNSKNSEAQNKDIEGKKFNVFEKQEKPIIKQYFEKVQHETYKEKQLNDLEEENMHMKKRKTNTNEFVKKRRREEKSKNNNLKSLKQQKNNSCDKEKKTIRKIEENLNKKNKSKNWDSNRGKKSYVEYSSIAQEKIIDAKVDSGKFMDIELESCNMEYDTNSNLNIIQRDKLNHWIVIKGKTDNKTRLSGTWFLDSGNARSQARWNNHRSDWVFDRANARRNKKHTSQWFFQRAFSRKQCQKNPNWCKSLIMTLQSNAKFR